MVLRLLPNQRTNCQRRLAAKLQFMALIEGNAQISGCFRFLLQKAEHGKRMIPERNPENAGFAVQRLENIRRKFGIPQQFNTKKSLLRPQGRKGEVFTNIQFRLRRQKSGGSFSQLQSALRQQ